MTIIGYITLVLMGLAACAGLVLAISLVALAVVVPKTEGEI
jgi:hypothetical protein